MHSTSGVLRHPWLSARGGKNSYLRFELTHKRSQLFTKSKMHVVCCHRSHCDRFKSKDSSIARVVARREHRNLHYNVKVLPFEVLKGKSLFLIHASYPQTDYSSQV